MPGAAQQTQLLQLHPDAVAVIFYCAYQITPATDQGPAEPEAKDHPVPTDLSPSTISDMTTAHKETTFEILYPGLNFIIWST